MRAVVQRVSHAKVWVAGEVVGSIGAGLCAFVGVGSRDTEGQAAALAGKLARLRIFEDPEGRMNLCALEQGLELLAISQFTLFGDVRRGNRPSFSEAMEPARAKLLFEAFCEECVDLGLRVERGRFREHMLVELVNDGPVTLLVDTERAF
jgi:D-tyrosyl-tRNA(Tyr) deacylase